MYFSFQSTRYQFSVQLKGRIENWPAVFAVIFEGMGFLNPKPFTGQICSSPLGSSHSLKGLRETAIHTYRSADGQHDGLHIQMQYTTSTPCA